jgi:hypothetical protein
MPALLEVVLSPQMLVALRRLRDGMKPSDVRKLPLRLQQLVARLDHAGLLKRAASSGGPTQLYLKDEAARLIPYAPARTPLRRITREQLDRLGLPDLPAFQIRAAADKHRLGRPSRPGPRVYMRRLPEEDFDPEVDLHETVLALLLFDGRAARAFVAARPGTDWTRLRKRIHQEKLAGRARYFGVHKLIGLRIPRKKTAIRHDAYRRADTEPIPRKPPR